MSEKTNQYPSKPPPPTTTCTQDEAVTALISAFQKHEKISHELRTAVNEIEISCGGWTEYIAQKIIETVQDIVKGGGFLLGVLDGAYKKAQAAMEGVEGFVKDHPVWAAAVIAVLALGICYVLMPWVLEAVGFGQIGPRAGSWAARWMTRYGEAVPKGSLYSFFQRMGMTWGKTVVTY